MDSLLQQVMHRLEERKHTSTEVSFNQQVTPPSDQIFLRNGKVILRNISISLVRDLYSMEKTNAWVNWVLEGISYDVKFYFLINEQMVNFIPRMMILDWPILFVVNNESPVIASHNRIITRGEIAAKPDKSILVRYQQQLITDEAVDICNYKKIKIKIRTEENCIWRVVGSVVATQKDPSLVGKKLMIVQQINSDQQPVRFEQVAADTVNAGIGDNVLIVRGAGARRADKERDEDQTRDVNDCTIVGIIDRFDK